MNELDTILKNISSIVKTHGNLMEVMAYAIKDLQDRVARLEEVQGVGYPTPQDLGMGEN